MLNISKISDAWRWFIDGLTEAGLAVLDRLARRRTFRIDLGSNKRIVDESGIALGRLVGAEDDLQLEPPGIAAALAESAMDVELPQRWVWRRTLPPVGVDSLPYLDAFVRHQIERISPWRPADVYYCMLRKPIENDATRFAIEVGIIPRRMVDPIVGMLKPLCARLRLVARGAGGTEDLIIPIGPAQDTRHRRIVRPLVATIAGVGLAAAGWIAVNQWQLASIDTEMADLDRQIATRKVALAAKRSSGATSVGDAILARRASRPYLVELVDALSQALPDHAHLLDLHFEKETIRISGISRRTAELVPTLERSGRFADVKFSAATTRLDDGNGDRFHLEMRAAGAAPGSKP